MRAPVHFLFLPVLLALVVLVSPQSRAEDRGEQAQIARLIERLGSADFNEREEATRALDALGAPALAQLKKAVLGEDPEVVRRAALVLQRVQGRIDTERAMQGKRVRLVYKDTPLHEAVADFNKKAGVNLSLEGDRALFADRKITLDTGETTFWDALDQFCRSAGLVEQSLLPDAKGRVAPGNPNAEYLLYQQRLAISSSIYFEGTRPAVQHDGRFPLVAKQIPAVPTFRAGPLRVRALPANVHVASPLLGEGERVLGLEVTPEPGFGWQGLLSVRVHKAVDDKGQVFKESVPYVVQPFNPYAAEWDGLLVWDVEGGYNPPEERSRSPWHVPVRLRLDKKPSKVLKEVHGTVAARVQMAPEPMISVDNPAAAVGQTATGPEGGSLKVTAFAQEKNGQVRVSVELDPPACVTENDPNALWARDRRLAILLEENLGVNRGDPSQGLTLVDEKGKAYRCVGADRRRLPRGRAPDGTLNLIFEPVGKDQGAPAKLVYNGRRSVVIEVPFTLKDVPMP